MIIHITQIETELDGQLGVYTVEYRINGFEVELIEVCNSGGEALDLSFADETALTGKIIAHHHRREAV